MLHHTKGLAISYIKYRETSIIAKIYTEKFGMQSYLVNGVRAAKSKMGLGFFAPMTQLQMVVYHKNQPDALQRISEIHIDFPYQKIGIDFHYTAISVFLTELLEKCLHQEQVDEELYVFIYQSFQLLDSLDTSVLLFPIRFLYLLSAYMGFGLQDASQLFQALAERGALVAHPITPQELELLHKVLTTPFTENVAVPLVLRRQMIVHLLDFYALHLQNFTTLKSLKILQESMG
jgi:DNA repair protein RecO (recombination protein O)